jgi:hypothetical protein
VIAGFGPRGELPSPLPLPLSLPLPLPFLLPCAPPSSPSRAPQRLDLLCAGGSASCVPVARPRARRRRPCSHTRPRAPPAHVPNGGGLARGPASRPRASPRSAAAASPAALAPVPLCARWRWLGPAAPCSWCPLPWQPRPRPRSLAPCGPTCPRALCSAPRRVSCAPAPRVPAAVCPVGHIACPSMRAACSHARNCSCTAFDSQLYLFFNFNLVDVLRHALRRATIHFKFIFINVLCRSLRCATIQFKFIFVNDLCRALRHATFRFKTQFS